MSALHHTPGPCRFERETQTVRTVPGNVWLATMSSAAAADDGVLFAAAADTLKALEEIAAQGAAHAQCSCNGVDECVAIAEAAIAKVKETPS